MRAYVAIVDLSVHRGDGGVLGPTGFEQGQKRPRGVVRRTVRGVALQRLGERGPNRTPTGQFSRRRARERKLAHRAAIGLPALFDGQPVRTGLRQHKNRTGIPFGHDEESDENL